MFERFTDRARRVVVLAQEEAARLGHSYIGTEHILLGLLSEREGVGGEALRSLGLSLEVARHEVEEMTGTGQSAASGHVPFTPRAKKVLELSLREALQLGHSYIGTEHILLGLVREAQGVAAQVMVKRGVGLVSVREHVADLAAQRPAGEPPPGERVGGISARTGRPFAVAAVYPHGRPAATLELLRVVPIAQTVDVEESVRLVLLSLEIWSGWLDLRMAAVGRAPGQLADRPLPYGNWTLSDDRGTAYQRVGTSAGGDDQMHVYQVSFSPTPPAEAKTLTLTLPGEGDGRDEIQVVVELSQR